MSFAEEIDRKTFLTSTLAWAALTLSGCGGGDDDSGGTGGTGGATGGTGGAMGGTGGAMGGTGGTGTPTYTCEGTVAVVNGHTHPLTIPGSDIAQGYQEAPYALEDGGTGHTHALTLSGYDIAHLQAGVTRMIESSTDSAHSHTCSVTCAMG